MKDLEKRFKEKDPRRKKLNRVLVGDRVIRNYSPEQKEPQPAKVFKVENGKVRKRKSRVGGIITLAGLIGIFALGVAHYPNIKDEIKFRRTYNQAQEQYGDANGDKIISPEEYTKLFNNIFYKTGITFSSEGIKYSDGREVSTSELTKIIREYINNPFPLGE